MSHIEKQFCESARDTTATHELVILKLNGLHARSRVFDFAHFEFTLPLVGGLDSVAAGEHPLRARESDSPIGRWSTQVVAH